MIDQQRHDRIVQHVLAGHGPDADGSFPDGGVPARARRGKLFFKARQLGCGIREAPGIGIGFDLDVEVAAIGLIRPAGIVQRLQMRVFPERRQVGQPYDRSKQNQIEPIPLQSEQARLPRIP
jgi:hypothetical protein